MRPRTNNSILLRIAQAEALVNYCFKLGIHPKDLYDKKVVHVGRLEYGENVMRSLVAAETLFKSLEDDVENFSNTLFENHLEFNSQIEHYFRFKRAFDAKAFYVSTQNYVYAAKEKELNVTIYGLIWGLLYRNVENFTNSNKKKLLSIVPAKEIFSAMSAAAISEFCFRSNENLILLKKNCCYKYVFHKRIFDESFSEENKQNYILHHAEKIIRESHTLKEMLIKSFECEKYQNDIAAFAWGAASCRFKKEKIPASFVYFQKRPNISVDILLDKSKRLMQLIKNSESTINLVV